MIERARFKTTGETRPVHQLKHPYWVAYAHIDLSVIVAYVEDRDDLLANWPEAEQIEWNPEDLMMTTQFVNAASCGTRRNAA